MRFTHSSLLTLTTVFTSSFLHQVSASPSSPVSPNDIVSTSIFSDRSMISSAKVLSVQSDDDKIEKRFDLSETNEHRHSKRCHNAAKNKKSAKKTMKSLGFIRKKIHDSIKKKSHGSSKKTTTRKTTTKRTTTKRTTTRKTTTKRRTTTKKTTTKKPTTENTSIKKSSSSSSSSGEFSGDGTYFTPALGSCGWDNKESDLIAALNAPQMHNGDNPNKNPLCGKYATVTGPKGTVRVKIVDTCPPCLKGSLDLSPAAFAHIGDMAKGRIHITWSWS